MSGKGMRRFPKFQTQTLPASGRACSARRLHRHQPVPPGRAGCRLLQSARHGRAVDQGRQGRDRVDAVVVPDVRCQCRTASQLHALAYNLGNFLRTLATPEPIKTGRCTSLQGEADQDRHQGWSATAATSPSRWPRWFVQQFGRSAEVASSDLAISGRPRRPPGSPASA